MSNLDWYMQVVVACVFLFLGFAKIFDYKRQIKVPQTGTAPGFFGLSYSLAVAIALVEIALALAVVAPANLWPPDILPRLAAMGLALLTIAAGFYHRRRNEPTGPSVALFLLVLFVIVGQWT